MPGGTPPVWIEGGALPPRPAPGAAAETTRPEVADGVDDAATAPPPEGLADVVRGALADAPATAWAVPVPVATGAGKVVAAAAGDVGVPTCKVAVTVEPTVRPTDAGADAATVPAVADVPPAAAANGEPVTVPPDGP